MIKKNKATLKECLNCKGGVMQHFDTCPHCGCCQSGRCEDTEVQLREKLGKNYNKTKGKKVLYKNQGFGNLRTDENNNPYSSRSSGLDSA